MDHEHEVVTHLFHIEVPYHLKPQEIEFEPNIVPNGNEWLELGGWKEPEIRRVLTSVVLLLQKYPHRTLADAINTAMVWERG